MTRNRYERPEQFVVVWHSESGAHGAHGPFSFREAQELARHTLGSVVVALTPDVVLDDVEEEKI